MAGAPAYSFGWSLYRLAQEPAYAKEEGLCEEPCPAKRIFSEESSRDPVEPHQEKLHTGEI